MGDAWINLSKRGLVVKTLWNDPDFRLPFNARQERRSGGAGHGLPLFAQSGDAEAQLVAGSQPDG